MKKEQIVKDGTYSDGKGSVRKVLDCGSQYVLYSGQAETDNLQYQLLSKKRGPHKVNSIHNSTRAAFASWAKEMI